MLTFYTKAFITEAYKLQCVYSLYVLHIFLSCVQFQVRLDVVAHFLAKQYIFLFVRAMQSKKHIKIRDKIKSGKTNTA